MLLATLLRRDRNNLDLFRLIAACMVIVAHAYPLTGAAQGDWVLKLLGHDNAGSLAVKLFFFLSGLVVTTSLLNKGYPLHFMLARIFRIWPAMSVTILLCALILGPSASTLPLREYLSDPLSYRYIFNNLALSTSYPLPGVFANNPYPSVVNGSLWTIPFEVAAYAILLGAFVLGIFRWKLVPLLLFPLILVDPLLETPIVFTWLPDNHHVTMLAPSFAFGALLATYREKIAINLPVTIGAWVLYGVLGRGTSVEFYFFYFALFLTVLYLSALPIAVRLKPPVDISFGVYLWAFPVQQLIASHYSDYGVFFNQMVALLICMPLGLLSWKLVEAPSIALGARLARRPRVAVRHPTVRRSDG